jgi:hypothetical protein
MPENLDVITWVEQGSEDDNPEAGWLGTDRTGWVNRFFVANVQSLNIRVAARAD